MFALADESGNIQGAGFRADGFQFSYHLGDKYPQPIWESALDNVAKPFFAVGGKDVQARWQVGEWETFAVIGLDEDGRRDYHQAGLPVFVGVLKSAVCIGWRNTPMLKKIKLC